MPDYKISIIVDGQDKGASNMLSGVGNALGGIGSIAGGILTAGFITQIGDAILGLGKSAISATADYQTMQVGLESLLAREIAKASEVTTITQGQRKASADELVMRGKLQDAYNAQADKLTALSKKYGDNSWQVLEARDKMADYHRQINALGITADGMIITQTKSTEATMKVSDAFGQATPKAKAMMDELAKIAILSPYQVQTVTDTFKTAMAFGYTSDEAKKFTTALLDMAAGVGADNERMDRMSYNLAQIRMVGKVTAVDIRQLAMAGLDLNSVLVYVGKQTGVNIQNSEDFNEAIASGKITWSQFTDSFAKYSKEQFGGASERMSRTLNGLKSTLSDVFALTMPKVLGPAAEAVTGFANEFLNNFLSIRDSGLLEAVGTKIGATVTQIIADVKGIFAVFQTQGLGAGAKSLLERIVPPETATLIISLINGVKLGFDKFGDFWKANGPGIQESIKKIFDKLVDVISDLSARVVPWIVTQINKLGKWFVDNGPLIKTFTDNFSIALTAVMGAVGRMWAFVQPLMTAFIDIILGLARFALQVANVDWPGAWQTIQNTVAIAWSNIQLAFTAFANWITTTFFGTTWTEVVSTWTTNVTLFSTIMETVWGTIKTTVSNAYTTFLKVGTDIIDGIKGGINSVWTSFTGWIQGILNGLPGPIKKALGLENWTISTPPMPATVTTTTNSTPRAPVGRQTARAFGGPVYAGQPYLVGEKGIELFVPRQSGKVIPNKDLLGLARPITINVYNQVDSALTAEVITNRVLQRLEELNN